MKRTSSGHGVRPQPSLIIELVGLAGTGKTTLFRALSQGDERIVANADLKLRDIQHIAVVFKQVPSLLPILHPRSRSERWFTWEEFKAMAYLRGWPTVLGRLASNHGFVILLDQGPVFKMATLDAFGPERAKGRAWVQWWRPVIDQWAATLDIVIWLTAPAEILIQRIRARSKQHDIKNVSDSEASRYLERYQASYERIFRQLAIAGGPSVLHIDTSQRTIEQASQEISAALTSHIGEWQASRRENFS